MLSAGEEAELKSELWNSRESLPAKVASYERIDAILDAYNRRMLSETLKVANVIPTVDCQTLTNQFFHETKKQTIDESMGLAFDDEMIYGD